jgi:glycosyltransferase involved in cell wall biosynthesis
MPLEAATPHPLPRRERWPVMVLAHNEEKHIVACLDSLFEGDPEHLLEVYVMANGCTDHTEALTLAYAARRPEVHLVSIAMGDKCNAWNVFVHDIVPKRCPDRSVYFFMDGDARSTPGSLAAMVAALEAEPHAHAASAPPASGRNVAHDRDELLEQRGLVANLYALRGSFLPRLIASQVRLPLKLEGDDGLLGALIKWDLDPKNNQFDHRRIVPCPNAGFEFESVSPFSPLGLRGYWKRAVRYGRRGYEFELLGRELKRKGLQGLPTDITHIYSQSDQLRLKRNGLYTVSNWFALRQMKEVGQSQVTQGLRKS